MAAPFPRVSSWSPLQEEDDGLDPLGPQGRKAVHRSVHQVRGGAMPSSSGLLETGAPSVVISPEAEIPEPPARPRKRVVEPTLVVRDKHQVEALRAGVRSIARKRARRKVLTVLTWGGASALAFGLGTALAFFVASSGRSADADAAPDAPLPTPATANAARSPGAAQREGSPASADEVPTAASPAAPATARAVPAPAPTVVSLEDLGDEPARPAAKRAAVGAKPSAGTKPSTAKAAPQAAPKSTAQPVVISLEDL